MPPRPDPTDGGPAAGGPRSCRACYAGGRARQGSNMDVQCASCMDWGACLYAKRVQCHILFGLSASVALHPPGVISHGHCEAGPGPGRQAGRQDSRVVQYGTVLYLPTTLLPTSVSSTVLYAYCAATFAHWAFRAWCVRGEGFVCVCVCGCAHSSKQATSPHVRGWVLCAPLAGCMAGLAGLAGWLSDVCAQGRAPRAVFAQPALEQCIHSVGQAGQGIHSLWWYRWGIVKYFQIYRGEEGGGCSTLMSGWLASCPLAVDSRPCMRRGGKQAKAPEVRSIVVVTAVIVITIAQQP